MESPITQAMQTQSVSDAVKIAANNFVLISVKVSFWNGQAKLSAAAEKERSQYAFPQAAHGAGFSIHSLRNSQG